ncbi:DUF2945 domain-containing protein [Rhizobium oryzicola]|uniref:DUF2945 domain-containing protein n=1 Tax=Rhizobium oryzicola TaxID=1232668 RepID=A0ABT8SUE5_9HYPH|nr:DUF2945 domain-containing protein [Rhizobium oryzicola]MDO1582055.1 DUF2945 domain-containing protein [Rhizobium oryzicola]
MSKIKEGDEVTWQWGRGEAEGKVVDTFTDDVTRLIKGKKIKRKASAKEPAVLVRQDDGARALKSSSEVHKS